MPTPDPGEVCWNEYLASDTAAATAFYTGLFGWTADGMVGESSGYTILKNGITPAAGLTHTPAPGIPSHWLTYILVEDCAVSAAKAQALGGKILSGPTDITPGRLAIVADPQGAVFGLFTPSR